MSDGVAMELGVLRNDCPDTQFFFIEPNRWYDARTHLPPHKVRVLAWLGEGWGSEARFLHFKSGTYEGTYGDLFSAIEDPEAGNDAPPAVTHWMLVGRP